MGEEHFIVVWGENLGMRVAPICNVSTHYATVLILTFHDLDQTVEVYLKLMRAGDLEARKRSMFAYILNELFESLFASEMLFCLCLDRIIFCLFFFSVPEWPHMCCTDSWPPQPGQHVLHECHPTISQVCSHFLR